MIQNTLIVFFSDNGGRVTGTYACNAPLRGMKGSFLEGDISEQENLYAARPEVVERLWEHLNSWEESLEDVPHWLEDPYWQGYNRRLYRQQYRLTQPAREADYRGGRR